MELNVNRKHIQTNSIAAYLYDLLEQKIDDWQLRESIVFFQFPIYKELDGGMVRADFLLISKYHGLLVFGLVDDDGSNIEMTSNQADAYLDQLVSYIFARLIRNKVLRETKTTLKISIQSCIFAPLVKQNKDTISELECDSQIITSTKDLEELFFGLATTPLDDNTLKELISTIDGSKGLMKPKKRELESDEPDSLGAQVMRLEAEIALFDIKQRHGYTIPTAGPQRIRGLAGSGKTVILAMKAALSHLENPYDKILFTFYTKSLYQHVKRLITRFYRQFDDKDPNWENILVRHAWGGRNVPGVYYDACRAHDVTPYTFTEAKYLASEKQRPIFDFICDDLIDKTEIKPIYDFVFIDEGQDFGASFINLCRLLAKEERVVWAYDELQNIFDVLTPKANEVFGTNENGEAKAVIQEDSVLHKCYRNPREIIVCAHALGFGIYGQKVVQMLENKGHWEDIGYEVIQGNFRPEELTVIKRPERNSPLSISASSTIDDIIICQTFKKVDNEVRWVYESTLSDIKGNLRPDDILIIVVDDRNFKTYASSLSKLFAQSPLSIECINTQNDKYGILDFQQSGHITISTINKAKGNEAYMVYVVGVDSLFQYPNVVSRNKLFTAITRAKAWVRITGIEPLANLCKKELLGAKRNFPCLKFKYPTKQEIRIMKRDLTRSAIEKQELERMLDQVMQSMSPNQIKDYVTKRARATKKEYKDDS